MWQRTQKLEEKLQIRKASPDDRLCWEALWLENCAYFGAASMDVSVIDGLWHRVINDDHAMNAWLATDGEVTVGLAHTIVHPHTFTLRPVCYLEDLWVTPTARGHGVARQMISHLTQIGMTEGWRRLYWETASDNFAVRRLYDRLAKHRPVVVYEIDLST